VGTIREEKKKEYQRRERVKSQKKEDAGARKGRTLCFSNDLKLRRVEK
jgi:hypothetical protein